MAVISHDEHHSRQSRLDPQQFASPALQVISPENLVGYMEQPKASNITKVFEDAYKSPLSIIILVSQAGCVFLVL